MKKLTGIVALAAASALVLAGCSTPAEEEVVTEPDTTQTETGSGSDAGSVTTPVEEELTGADLLRVKPGRYSYSYTYINDYNTGTGFGGSGTMVVGENGSCEFDMGIVDFSEPIEDGAILEITTMIARTVGMKDATIYDMSEVDQNTFTVETSEALVGSEDIWNTTYNDQFLGLGTNAVGDFAGPCWFLALPDMLVEHPTITDPEQEAWAIDAAKIQAFEEARLAETAELLFGLEDDKDTLTAAWIESVGSLASFLGDPNSVWVTKGSSENAMTPEDISINISRMSQDGGLGSISWSPEPADAEFPYSVYLPTITTPYTIGNRGQDLAAELRG